MSTREERVSIFRDTQEWIKDNDQLQASLDTSFKRSRIYYENDYPDNNRQFLSTFKVEVTKERSFEAAMRLKKENNNWKTAVLNFANAFRPGGGVTYGSSAQEECLCRTSTLYPLIHNEEMRNTFYKHHNDLHSAWATDSLIYTKDVIICKSDADLPQRLKPEQWVKCDVITMAAPDLSRADDKMDEAQLYGFHVKRAIHMFYAAAAQEADCLVLGAFGCGAFQNDPQVVANAYKTALTVFPKLFHKIVFAVYCAPMEESNYITFHDTLDSMH